MDQDAMESQIREMRPWHHDIQISESLSTGRVFSETGKLPPPENDGVSLISPREWFRQRLFQLYPEGLGGRSFLDCACNAGGYCFWARELDAARVVGFDVREHWIDQARFVQQHRTVEPVDRIEFHVSDLYDVPHLGLDPFDMTYFSGIFYHLPDPITGLKIAADLTQDVIVLNTAMMPAEGQPPGLTMARESRTRVMSGVHELSWFPNSKETLSKILLWLGFADQRVTLYTKKEGTLRARIEIIAAREPGRLDALEGERLT